MGIVFTALLYAQDVAQLVRDLGSESADSRAEAHAKLREIGEPALDALREARKSSDPEAAARARDLQWEIERAERVDGLVESWGKRAYRVIRADTESHKQPEVPDLVLLGLMRWPVKGDAKIALRKLNHFADRTSMTGSTAKRDFRLTADSGSYSRDGGLGHGGGWEVTKEGVRMGSRVVPNDGAMLLDPEMMPVLVTTLPFEQDFEMEFQPVGRVVAEDGTLPEKRSVKYAGEVRVSIGESERAAHSFEDNGTTYWVGDDRVLLGWRTRFSRVELLEGATAEEALKRFKE